MSEAFFTLAGVAVGGLITMAVSFLRQSHEERMAQKNFERQRLIAAESHAREVTTKENEELSSRLREQLAWGDRLSKAVWRVTDFMKGVGDKEERFKILSQAAAMFGMDFNQVSEMSKLLPPEFFEDDELRGLVAEHQDRLSRLEMAFVFADGRPGDLPDDPEKEHDIVAGLKRGIEIRRRQVLRTGTPL